jgi:hypothetical protein
MAANKPSKENLTERIEKYSIFLRWWLFFSIISFGTFMLIFAGIIQKINHGDITKISFLIYVVFVIFTLRTGMDTYQLCREEEGHISKGKIEFFAKRNEVGWFTSDILLSLGMIGTVLGFIYMLSTSLSEVNPSNTQTLRSALIQVSTGMSTALYTTAAGLVCSLLLKLQLFNFSNRLEDVSEKRDSDHAPQKLP